MAELRDRKPVESWSTDFDHFDPTYLADPDAVWAELRGQCPVAHSDRYGGVNVLSRWAEVYEAIHDPDRFTSRRLIINEVPTDRRGVTLPPINLDPPDHNDRRRALLPFFAPPAIKRWEEPIRQICRRELDRLAGRTEVDLAVDYAQVVPAELTAIMLGVPLDDVPMFREWLHDLLEVGPTDEAVMRATTATMMDYMRNLAVERRQHRGDDVVSFLLETEFEDGPITDDELTRMLYLFLIAGIDTTWSSIGSSLLHLARHPEDRQRLAADPSLIPMAVEEFLRFYPPVWVARIATE
ncbi:MAG: cytochrome P450, partial [Acidimicrobiia bacterium]|nr:cytochrome P450 [Acidimicrobiia bacterium]